MKEIREFSARVKKATDLVFERNKKQCGEENRATSVAVLDPMKKP